MDSLSTLTDEIVKLLTSKKPGERLPSERALAQAFNVSRASVKRALLQLVAEGRVEHQTGHCPRVAAQQGAPLALERLLQIEPGVKADLVEFVERLSQSKQGAYPASITSIIQRLEHLSSDR